MKKLLFSILFMFNIYSCSDDQKLYERQMYNKDVIMTLVRALKESNLINIDDLIKDLHNLKVYNKADALRKSKMAHSMIR